MKSWQAFKHPTERLLTRHSYYSKILPPTGDFSCSHPYGGFVLQSVQRWYVHRSQCFDLTHNQTKTNEHSRFCSSSLWRATPIPQWRWCRLHTRLGFWQHPDWRHSHHCWCSHRRQCHQSSPRRFLLIPIKNLSPTSNPARDGGVFLLFNRLFPQMGDFSCFSPKWGIQLFVKWQWLERWDKNHLDTQIQPLSIMFSNIFDSGSSDAFNAMQDDGDWGSLMMSALLDAAAELSDTDSSISGQHLSNQTSWH